LKTNDSFFTQTVFNMQFYIHQNEQRKKQKTESNKKT